MFTELSLSTFRLLVVKRLGKKIITIITIIHCNSVYRTLIWGYVKIMYLPGLFLPGCSYLYFLLIL